MAINLALIIASALVVGGTLYILFRWRRAPRARRAMTTLSVCFFAAGALLGYSALYISTKRDAVLSLNFPNPQIASSPAGLPVAAQNFIEGTWVYDDGIANEICERRRTPTVSDRAAQTAQLIFASGASERGHRRYKGAKGGD